MGVTVFSGLHDHHRADAASIYWEAFGSKLGKVLGPDDRALDYLVRVIRADLCLTAVDDDDRLIGIAGFKVPGGSFASGTLADLMAVYGRPGGLWRSWVFRLLGGEIDNDRFLIDGICVAQGHRGQGVGSQLLAGLYAEAIARGYGWVRLDVVEGNWRARALYERHGFLPTRTERLGMLRLLFGFASATTMVRPLPLQDA